MHNNKSCLGLYVGFSLFAIQTIAGELYRDYKQQQYNNRINSRLFISGSATTRATTTKAQESTKH